jgi:endonuclease YncB( thermonuclease family)
MMKYLIVVFLISNISFAQGPKHRGYLVKVVSATQVQVKEDKKPITLTLGAVSDKGLTKDQKNKAIDFIKQKLNNQVLIWEEVKGSAKICPNGLGELSKTLIQEGLLKAHPKAPEEYLLLEKSAQENKVGLWHIKE